MAGIDWHALPTVCELLGIADPARLIEQLITIRDHHRGQE